MNPKTGGSNDDPETSQITLDHTNNKEICDIHLSFIRLIEDDKARINKETGSQLLQLLARLMSISSRQEAENAALRAVLVEREKNTTYADVLRGNRNDPNGLGGRPSVDALQTTPQPPGPGRSPAQMDHAMLIYLRSPALNASNNIKVILKKYFEPHSLGLGEVSVRDIREGVAVLSSSAEGLQNLQDAIEIHPSTKDLFVLKKPTKRRPQFRVSGVDPDILSAEFFTKLQSQNPEIEIEPSDFSHRISFKEKSGNNTHIFEVSAKVYKKLKETNKLRLGWTSCSVTENFYVPRCDKCCTYGHTKAKCASQMIFCSICAGNHPAQECRITNYEEGKCRACINRRVNANHPFGASECGTHAFHVSQLRSRTDYPK